MQHIKDTMKHIQTTPAPAQNARSIALAHALKSARASMGISQAAMAKSIGCNRSTIARFEKTGVLTVEFALAYMELVGVSLTMPSLRSPYGTTEEKAD